MSLILNELKAMKMIAAHFTVKWYSCVIKLLADS